jgi:hypothetical protein
MKVRFFFMVLGLVLVLVCYSSAIEVPKLMHYQGRLTTSAGAPVNDTLQMIFSIYADSAGTNLLWADTQATVEVLNGMFDVLLGSKNPIAYSVFDGNIRYLGIEIPPDPEMTPRRPIVSGAYAYKSFEADTADYARTGGGSDNDWAFPQSAGGTNPRPYLYTYGPWGIARYGNILYGDADYTHVNLGVACTTGTSGQNYECCTVGGGERNTASGYGATVGGGHNNHASGSCATAGGGYNNLVSSAFATVGGGYGDTAGADWATVGGGYKNVAGGMYATIGGGDDNKASNDVATVGGGYDNTASSYATVGGGVHNTASGLVATVGGGWSNNASGEGATVGGGMCDTASGLWATVSGGGSNIASGQNATVGGGRANNATSQHATVGGGYSNTASGYAATVPGGEADTAAGDYSLAAGINVTLTSSADYTFAFGNSFGTSASHAVIFYDHDAPIKVGIQTTTPTERLDVAGTAQMTGFKMPTGAANGYVLTSDPSGVGTWQPAAGGSDNDWVFPTSAGGTNPRPYVYTFGPWGIARYGNVLYGNADSTHVNLGVASTTGTSGQNYEYCTVGGGDGNTASNSYATAGGGGGNTASGLFATVPGGHADTAGGDYSFAAGDRVRITSAGDYTFAFGSNFTTSASHAVIFHDTNTPIKVGIGTTSPTERLDVAGTAQMTGFKMPTGAANGYVLTSDASGVGTWQSAVGGIGGSGTTNYIPKFTGSTTLGNSAIYQSGSNVGIGTTSPNEQLEITGNLRLPATTATAGIIKVGGDRFIHNYGYENTFVGVNAGNLTMTGYDNTANGTSALFSNTAGYWNTANGTNALYSNTTGYANTANGGYALYSNTTGWLNTANGYQALDSNTTGSANTANGFQALYSNTTGSANTANGFQALDSNTEGYGNTANGVYALNSNTTGGYNTANGMEALYQNTTGHENTANGLYALGSNTTGYYNTALGYQADVSSGDLTNATAIGYAALVDASNKVRIGDAGVTSIGGHVGWTTFSDGRYEKSISENVPGLAFISKLKPVTYTMDVDAIDAVLRPPRQPLEGQSQEDLMPSAEEIASRQAQSQIVYTGFIAQEVEKAAQETGYDFSGVDAPKSDKGMYGLRYAEFVVPLVKAVQEQQQMIQEQQQMIQELQKRIEELEKK